VSKEIYLDSDTVKREVVVLWERMKLNAPLIADDDQGRREAYAKLVQTSIAHATVSYLMLLNLGVDAEAIEDFRLKGVEIANHLMNPQVKTMPRDAAQLTWCPECKRQPLNAIVSAMPTCAGCGSRLIPHPRS
jgi:hypothetical protein